MRRRLAVRHHDDLLVAARVPRQQLLRHHQPMLDVRVGFELVPAQIRQCLRLHLTRIRREPHHVQAVAAELRANKRVQRQRDFLGRHKVAAHRHGQAQVDHQHR